MTVSKVYVSDLGELAKAFGKLADEWEHIAEYAMKNALLRTGYYDRVWQRTPKSDRNRYAAKYRGVDMVVKRKGKENDPSSWKTQIPRKREKAVLSWAETPREHDRRARAVQRLNEYGMERLANSVLPYGRDSKSLQVRRRQGTIELVLSSSVPYAARMHEAKKPREGEYWTPGEDSGWSASRTGNRYLDKPHEELQDKILKEFVKGVDQRLRNLGLM